MANSSSTYQDVRLPVPEEFSDVFSHFYFAANRSTEPVTKTLMPSFQSIMVFNFGSRAVLHTRQGTAAEMHRCIVLGPVKTAFDYTLPPGSEILVVNFKADAFFRFFGQARLSDHLPADPNDALADDCFARLWHQLDPMSAVADRVGGILDFCRPYLKPQDGASSLLSGFESDSQSVIKSVAGSIGQTERNVQLMHKKYFGYSTKERGRYERFIKAVGLLQQLASSGDKVDWFEIIGACGYYDQSQLIHDFRHFMNISPKKYLRLQTDICWATAD